VTDTTVAVQITLASAQFKQATQEAQRQFESAMKALQASGASASQQLSNAFKQLKITPSADLQAEANKIRAAFKVISTSADASASDIARAAQAMKQQLAELSNQAKLNFNTGNLDSVIAKVTAATGAFISLRSAVDAVKSIIETGMGLETINSKLMYVTGSSEQARREWEYVKQSANSLGLEVTSLANVYSTFSASTKGTALEGQQTKDIFLAVAKTAAALKLPVSEVQQAFTALGQMASKGTIQMEELKGQLAEHIPGALQVTANALGVTLPELMDMSKEGKLLASEVLPKFAEELNKLSEGSLPTLTDNVQSQFNILQNQLIAFKETITNAGLFTYLIAQLKEWNTTLQQMSQDGSLNTLAQNISNAVVSIINSIINVVKFIVEWRTEIMALVASIAMVKLGGWITALASLNFSWLPVALAGFAVLIQKAYDYATQLSTTELQAQKLKETLTQYKNIELDKVFINASQVITPTLQKINSEYQNTIQQIKNSDQSYANFYENLIGTRTKQIENAQQNEIRGEQQIKQDLEQLAAQKKTLNTDYTNNKIKLETEHLSNSKNYHNSLLVLENAAHNKALEINQNLRLEKDKYLKEMLNSEKTALSETVRNEKQASSEMLTNWNNASKERELKHKEALQKITAQEEQLKATHEQLKEQTIAIESKYIKESIELANQRYESISELNTQLTAVIRENILNKLQVEKNATEIALAVTRRAEEDKVVAIREKTTEAIAIIKQQQTAEQEAKKTIVGQIKNIFTDETNTYRQHYDNLSNTVRDGINTIIALKTGLISSLKSKLSEYESEMQRHAGVIKGIDKTIADFNRSILDTKFDIRLMGMSDVEKFNALLQKGTSLVNELTQNRIAAAQQGKSADQSTIETLNKLQNEVKSVATQMAGMGRESTSSMDAVISKSTATSEAIKLIDSASEQVNQAYQDSKTVAEGAFATAKDKAQQTEQAIQSLYDQVSKFNMLSIELNMDDLDVSKIEEVANKLKEMVAQENISVDMETSKAIAKLHDLQVQIEQPTQVGLSTEQAAQSVQNLQQWIENTPSTHTVIANTAQAEAAIANLQRDTFSTHYIRVVERRAGGGLMRGFNRLAGLIRGAGTATSDSIPAMLSNGEFVMKADAVKKWGTDFLYALNNGFFPTMPVRHYASGGLVTSSGTAKSDTVTVELKIGSGNPLSMRSSRQTALDLTNALRELSRSV
jgi:tape measure domain-containing protein